MAGEPFSCVMISINLCLSHCSVG